MEDLIKNILGIRSETPPPLPKGTKAVSYKDLNSPQARFDRAVEALKQKGWQEKGQETPHSQGVLGAAVQSLQKKFSAGAQAPRPSPTLAPDASEFEQTALPILNKYEIPPSVAFGMAHAEGGRIGTNNPFNINAVDSNPNAATNYDSPQAGIEAFARLIAEDERYKKAYELRSNPEAMLQAIKDAGYAGDPKTWKKRSIEQARRIGKHGAGEIYDAYDQFVKDTPGYRRYQD